jgi:hypothetical protein
MDALGAMIAAVLVVRTAGLVLFETQGNQGMTLQGSREQHLQVWRTYAANTMKVTQVKIQQYVGTQRKSNRMLVSSLVRIKPTTRWILEQE